jgi:broad specificity phosphatase PhoE
LEQVTALVLIRHAQVVVDPAESADQWQLTPEGEADAATLRKGPEIASARRFFSSPEPKALATAAKVASGRPVIAVHDLRELDRRAAGWFGDSGAYASMVEQILEQPGVSILGCETAAHAQSRIVRAVGNLARRNPDEPIAVVSHGIVLALYVSWLRGQRIADVEAWRRMRFPDVAVIDPALGRVLRDFGGS